MKNAGGNYENKSLGGYDKTWMGLAACKGLGHFFYPKPFERPSEVKEREAIAKSICEVCKVEDECLEYAIINREYGVWGGCNEGERKVIINSRKY